MKKSTQEQQSISIPSVSVVFSPDSYQHRIVPSMLSPKMFGCKSLILSVLEMVTAFDRNVQVRENPVRTLAAARDRERCKHASDYLHRGTLPIY